MGKEILACIKKTNVKFLHSGQISKFIFPMERKEAHQKKVSHLIVRFFIVTISKNNDLLYLVQKRSNKKEDFPEYYTDSASGHVKYREDLNLNDIKENAKRELREEFGISPNSIKKVQFYDLNAESNKGITEIAYIFLGLVNPEVDLNPDPDELDVKKSKFYTKAELVDILSNEKSIDYSKKIWNKIINLDIFEYFDLNNNLKQRQKDDSNIALFIGRFQPLHHGHIYVINYLLRNYKKIKIGIGSSQLSHTKENPFTSEERIKFIKAVLKKREIKSTKYDIYEIPDIFNAQKWVDHVMSIIGKFDIIFSNSDWVRELFRSQGFLLGKKLSIFKNKYNGTRIRNLIKNKNNNWKSLVPNEVVNLITKFDGVERINQLYKKEN